MVSIMPGNSTRNPVRKPLKPCKEFGCNELTRNSYCKNHEKNAQKTHRIYNKYKRNQTAQSFYNSYEWQKVRRARLEMDNYLCQSCLRQGIVTKADVVHHIIELLVDWSKRLDINNLESVCHSCHNREHNTVPRG